MVWKLAARPLFFKYWFGRDPDALSVDELTDCISADYVRLFHVLERDAFRETSYTVELEKFHDE